MLKYCKKFQPVRSKKKPRGAGHINFQSRRRYSERLKQRLSVFRAKYSRRRRRARFSPSSVTGPHGLPSAERRTAYVDPLTPAPVPQSQQVKSPEDISNRSFSA